MAITRREFLGTTLVAAASTALPASGRAMAPLKVLVIGGTGFLGPHTVRRLQERGHTVTLFNRGRTNPGLFPDVEKLRGDRKTDLKALDGRKWDAVLDPSAYIPADVTRSATLLAPNVGHYLLISTISVYKALNTPGMDETAPLATLKDPTVEQVTGETYGGLKVLCEQAAEKAMPGKTTVIRPGLIVGPGDTTDRFTYWPVRVAKGGEVLAPNSPNDFVQCIDVRDLANFIVSCLENRSTGIYNADGPQAGLTIGRLLETSKQVSKSDATFVWVPTAFLEAAEGPPVERHAGVGAADGRRGRWRSGERQGRDGEGPDAPPAGRDGPGHARLRRHVARRAQGQAQVGPVARAREGSAGGVEDTGNLRFEL